MAAAGEMREAYIRILLTRGVGDLSDDFKATPTPSLVILVKPVPTSRRRASSRTDQVFAGVDPPQPCRSVNPIIKSNNLLNNAFAMRRRCRQPRRRSADVQLPRRDRRMRDANFFMVRDGVALTPRSEAGLLEGITREFIFEVGDDAGVRVENATLFPADSSRRGSLHHRLYARAEPGLSASTIGRSAAASPVRSRFACWTPSGAARTPSTAGAVHKRA